MVGLPRGSEAPQGNTYALWPSRLVEVIVKSGFVITTRNAGAGVPALFEAYMAFVGLPQRIQRDRGTELNRNNPAGP